MTLRALIADDEPLARLLLREYLAAHPAVQVVAEADNGLDAARAVQDLAPDLVFLDIQMPGLLGTEVIARVQHRPFVVFTTAYAEHAVTGTGDDVIVDEAIQSMHEV